MDSPVADILLGLNSIAQTLMGAEWKLLPFTNDLNRNDLRRSSAGFGCRPLNADFSASLTNQIALDHVFENILMKSVTRTDDESEMIQARNMLYDGHSAILAQAIRTRVNNVSPKIMLVYAPQLAEPEYPNGGQFVAIRQRMTVRYRQTY